MRSNNKGIKASMHSEEFILRFDSDSDEFSRGFSCGEIWACLTDEVAEVHCITTVDNIEMVMRMAEATHYSFNARDLTEAEIQALEVDEPGNWIIVIMRYQDDQS